MDTSPKRKMSKVNFIAEPSKVSFTVFKIAQNTYLYIVLAKISKARIPVRICDVKTVQTID